MGRREFYAWVDQAAREQSKVKANDPHSWDGADEDEWWQEARRRRDEAMGR